jgi:hypothetical protein
MRRFITPVLTLALCVGLLAGVTGCDRTLTEPQMKTIAQQAGMWAAVSWIAVDNPAPAQLVIVRGLMDVVETSATSVGAGKTYTEVVFPPLVQYIDESVELRYQPFAKTGVLSLLNALDMLFVMYPEWRADEGLALGIVQSFITGARGGLALAETSPIMQQAREVGTVRVMVFRQVRARELELQLQQLKQPGAQPKGPPTQ